MKVQELFEKLQSGAFMAPGYRADEKTLVGSVKDWLDAGGVKPEHVKAAMAQIKKSDIFKDMQAAGMKYAPSPKKEDNGTFNFDVARHYVKTGKTVKGSYQVFANGQIRSSTLTGGGEPRGQTKLVSPKPKMVVGKPVDSLVKTYTAALKELLSKWNASRDNPKNQGK